MYWQTKENGSRGYTGSIAEKRDFLVLNSDIELRAAQRRAADRLAALRAAHAQPFKIEQAAAHVEHLASPDRRIALLATAANMLDGGDRRIDDKWGPAGCFELSFESFIFFGWAAS